MLVVRRVPVRFEFGLMRMLLLPGQARNLNLLLNASFLSPVHILDARVGHAAVVPGVAGLDPIRIGTLVRSQICIILLDCMVLVVVELSDDVPVIVATPIAVPAPVGAVDGLTCADFVLQF